MYSSMLKYIEQLLKSSSVLDQTSKTKGSNTSSKSIAFVHTGFLLDHFLDLLQDQQWCLIHQQCGTTFVRLQTDGPTYRPLHCTVGKRKVFVEIEWSLAFGFFGGKVLNSNVGQKRHHNHHDCIILPSSRTLRISLWKPSLTQLDKNGWMHVVDPLETNSLIFDDPILKKIFLNGIENIEKDGKRRNGRTDVWAETIHQSKVTSYQWNDFYSYNRQRTQFITFATRILY